MIAQSQHVLINQAVVVDALAQIRCEWEQATGGESLVTIEASVGLLLADLVMALRLPPMERVQALGEELVGELQDVFYPRNRYP